MESMLAHGLESQFLAALATLKDCIDRCPDAEWRESRQDRPYCQVLFHALFDCDLVLSATIDEFKDQPFHARNRALFGAYEELEDRPIALFHDRAFIIAYHGHCREKAELAIRRYSDADLLVAKADIYATMTKVERFVNGIRHLQHHAAQLGFRLQLLTGQEMRWVGRGYEEGQAEE